MEKFLDPEIVEIVNKSYISDVVPDDKRTELFLVLEP